MNGDEKRIKTEITLPSRPGTAHGWNPKAMLFENRSTRGCFPTYLGNKPLGCTYNLSGVSRNPNPGCAMLRSFLTDEMYAKLEPFLPPERGGMGHPPNPHRPIIEAILWKHRTGAPWRDLPAEYGPWNSVFTRFNRWSKVGLWQAILETLRGEADTEWLMVDATIIRAHQHASGAEKGGSSTRRSDDPEEGFPPRST